MKNLITFMFTLVLAIAPANAQDYETNQEAKEKLKQLEFITGNWKGTGWKMDRSGVKHNFDQTEKVSFKLDSTAILIEGQGRTNGKLIHNAMAVVSFDQENNNYDFHSFLQNGRKGTFEGELKENKFYWYPNEGVRYIIELDENGNWQEIGQYNMNGEWVQFFEMNLEKL